MRQWTKPNKVEWLSFLFGMPFLAALLNYFLFGESIFRDYRIWTYSFPIIYGFSFIFWYLRITIMHWLRIRFPAIKQTTLRLVLLALAHISILTFTFLMLFY